MNSKFADKKIQEALEELHSASLCWGALVQREDNNEEFQEAKKNLQVAAYNYYKSVMEVTLTLRPAKKAKK